MKEHVLRALALIVVFFSYFAWRINMTGLNPVIYLFVLIAVIALVIIIRLFCREPKNNEKRKQDRMILVLVLALFLAAVLIRIIFLYY